MYDKIHYNKKNLKKEEEEEEGNVETLTDFIFLKKK